jgi:hypothetical protein
MKIAQAAGIALSTALLLVPTAEVRAQANSIESINASYERELAQLERRRLEQLGRLALAEPKERAAVTLDLYFRLAIAKNLYADADPVALRVIEADDSSPAVSWLAH